MAVLSLGSAGDIRVERGGNAPAPRKRTAKPNLYLEAATKAYGLAAEAAFTHLRSGWLYRLSLTGPIPDRISCQPVDARSRLLDEAEPYFRGRFRFAGDSVDAKDGSVFDMAMPSDAFAEALHGFEWLRHIEAAGGENARKLALKLVGEWLERYAGYSKPAWQPEIIGARLINLVAHGRFFLTKSDLVWRSKFFVSLRNQARILSRTLDQSPDGLPRLQATAALAMVGFCFSDTRAATQGLKSLAREIDRQILADGGHVTRSPQALVDAFRILSMVQQSIDAAHRDLDPYLAGALDRMAPMLRFFCLGDGGLGVFNGGNEGGARQIEALFERDDANGKPFGHAPHSAFQRLAAAKTLLLFDVGGPPPGEFATHAHAGSLSFEMSAGEHRIIVNCGSTQLGREPWNSALRATAAHSGLTLCDTSSSTVLPAGWRRNLLGPRLVARETRVQTRRSETAEGIAVSATHDFYLPKFGVLHERSLMLSPRGLALSGVDRLMPRRRKAGQNPNRPFAIRFHIHPDVRLSLAHGGASVLLKLPNGEGWRFRCEGFSLAIEESVYLGSGPQRRAEQVVVTGHVRDDDMICNWALEQVVAASV